MGWAEKTLVVVLRFAAVLLMLAFGAIVMPFEWMAATHRSLGLGDLPNTPMIGYLTRSLSALYAMHGMLLFYISCDIRRYLPLVRFLAVMGIAFGAGMIVLDIVVGLPLSWTVGEGPFIIAIAVVELWLVARVNREIQDADR